jgi:hypothetical protein
LETIAKAPGVETLWQLHFSGEGGTAYNTAERYIANIQGADEGHFLELTAGKDGGFEVRNTRTNFAQKYSAIR